MLRSLLGLSLFAAAIGAAQATDTLDPAFGNGGALVFNASLGSTGFDYLHGGMIDSSGRYVGAGYSQTTPTLSGALVRILPNGMPDPAFGTNGVVRFPRHVTYTTTVFTDVVEQPDGKLVVAGRVGDLGLEESAGRAYVCRVLASGALDVQFGGGCVSPTFHPDSSHDVVHGMALQADGRIVIVGGTDVQNDQGPREWVVARINSDGTLDTCFGDATCQHGGMLIQPEPNADLASFEANAVAIAQDQKIVIAGRASVFNNVDMAVVRLQPTGDVDTAFGDGGHKTVAFDQGGGDFDRANALVVRGDNSIVIAGDVRNDFGYVVGVAAFNALGAPLTSFGTQGKQMLYYNDVTAQQYGTGLALQSDGKLVVSGYTNDPATQDQNFDDCGVARLTANGKLDPTFGYDGALTIDASLGVDPRPDLCYAVAVRGVHIMLFGLRVPQSGYWDTMFVRLYRDSIFANDFQ